MQHYAVTAHVKLHIQSTSNWQLIQKFTAGVYTSHYFVVDKIILLNVFTSPGQPFLHVECLDYLLRLDSRAFATCCLFFLFVPIFILILTAWDLYALVNINTLELEFPYKYKHLNISNSGLFLCISCASICSRLIRLWISGSLWTNNTL